MTPEMLVAAVLESPSYRTLPSHSLDLVVHACELLGLAGPAGLSPEDLQKSLRKWFRGDALEDSMQPTLERYGLFRWTVNRTWSLADPGRLSLSFADLPVCVVDVEATGGRPPLHRIIELGVVRVEPDGRVSTLESLVNPARPLPPFITFMTGLKQAQIDAAPSMKELMPQLAAFFEGTILIAHDVSGDMELLNYEFFRESGGLLDNQVVCTVAVTRALRPKIDRTGLEFVARELGITFEQEHRALADAEATVAIWDILKQDLLGQGVRTLLDLSFYQGQIPSPLFLSNRISVERLEGLPANPGCFKLLGPNGRLVHAEAVADVRKTLRDYFYPRYKQPPLLKKIMRETLDVSYELFPSFEEAQAALESEKLKPPQTRRRRWRRGR